MKNGVALERGEGRMERLTWKGYQYHSCDFMDDGVYEWANKLREYEDAEEQELLLRLPCETVWYIVDKNSGHATIMSKSITDLTLNEITAIDQKSYHWSTKEKAEQALKKMEDGE